MSREDLLRSFFGRFESRLMSFMLFVMLGVGIVKLCCINALGFAWWLALGSVIIGTWRITRSGRNVACFVFVTSIAFLFAAILLPTPSTDGGHYHYPAILALAKGWNPIYEGTNAGLSRFVDIAKLSHVTVQCKGAWYFAAACMRGTGFFDCGSTVLGLFAMVIAFCWWRRAWRIWHPSFPHGVATLLAIATTVTPWCLFSIGDPMIDGASSHLLIALVGATLVAIKEKTIDDVLGVVWLGVATVSLKLTALPLVALLGVFVSMALARQFGAGVWMKIFLSAGLLLLAINASPFITNAVHHGSPLYPTVTFGQAGENLTADFDEQNADRASMGRLGRWTYAFFSKEGTGLCYRLKTGRQDFRPTVLAPEGIEGFGAVFRWVFSCMTVVVLMLSLAGRARREKDEKLCLLLLGILVLSSFTMPLKYIGCGRYVAGFFVAPHVGALLAARWVSRETVGAACALAVAVFMAFASARLLLPSAGRLALLSVQNVFALDCLAMENPGARVAEFSLPENSALRYWLQAAYPGRVRFVDRLSPDLKPFMTANFSYTCGLRESLPLPPVHWTQIQSDSPWVNYDRAAIAKRLASYVKNDFLPWMLRHPFDYFGALMRLRKAQFTAFFKEDPK